MDPEAFRPPPSVPERAFIAVPGSATITTRIEPQEALELAEGFETEASSIGLKIYLESTPQIWGLQKLILRSIEVLLKTDHAK